MNQIALRRDFSGVIVDSSAIRQVLGGAGQGWQDKSADHGRAHVVGCVRHFRHWSHRACWRLSQKSLRFQSIERHRTSLNVISSQ